jgi:hypothetical protein
VTGWERLKVYVATTVAIVSVPALAVAWYALLGTHATWDAMWWLALAVLLWITYGVALLWRTLWPYLRPTRRL